MKRITIGMGHVASELTADSVAAGEGEREEIEIYFHVINYA